MGGIFSPSQPSQPAPVAVPQPVIEPVVEEADVEQRDIGAIDKLRRRQQQPSLLQLLSDGGRSPTIL